MDQLKSAEANPDKVIILLTDGATNTGLSKEDIMRGPVDQAKQAGICVYTVGYADAGDLDEAFLRQIAGATSCGEYYYAEDAAQLESKYLKIRHQSAGNMVGEFTGRIAKGETKTAGEISVPGTQAELHATLNWPGSTLELDLVDPGGETVSKNYSGASITVTPKMVYIIVRNPKQGRWSAKIRGIDVGGATTSYGALFSVRPAAQPPIAPLLLIAVSCVGALALIYYLRKSHFGKEETGAETSAICPHCHSLVPPKAAFCPVCGAAQ